MPRANLRGHTIHFQQTGQGPDIVLIHGLFCNIAFWWFRVAPKLAEKHRVTALDLRGHGFSAMSGDGYRAVDLAEDVVALMGHLGIVDAHVIGHSFGGAVALAVAAQHPERVNKLTLADAWVPSMQSMPQLNDSEAWTKLQARLAKRGIVVQTVRGFAGIAVQVFRPDDHHRHGEIDAGNINAVDMVDRVAGR